jgi:hypothetical protein
VTVADVQVGQIITLHQADEKVNLLNIQLLAGIAGFLCHAFTPVHDNRLRRVMGYRAPAPGRSSRNARRTERG